MRIALVLGSSNVGGTELNTLRTVSALMRHGHDVTLVLIGSPGTLVPSFVDTGVRLIQVPSRSLVHPQIRSTVLGIRDAVANARAEVVHSQDVFGNIIGVPAARLARAPAVLSSRRWWKATPRRVHRTLNRAAYSLSAMTVANAPSVAAMLMREERLPATKVAVIPNIIDERLLQERAPTTRQLVREQLNLPHDAIVLMCVARLMPVKNHAMLISAFASLSASDPRLRLVLVGGGALRGRLEAQAERLGVASAVVFAGERKGGASLYAAADIAVLTSLSEGMPNSLLEAMACDLPVVATAVGGCVDVVRQDVTGLLVPSGDDEALATALATLISSHTRRVEMGLAGREVVIQTHTEATVIPQLIGLYSQLLAKP